MRATSLLPLAGAVAVLALAGCGGGGGGTAATPDPAATTPPPAAVATDPHGTPITALRTVVLRRGTVSPSPRRAMLHTRLAGGMMPAGPTTATVLTDEDCEPDAAGISHCRNRLILADGQTIEVRHLHNMGMVPCLAPGEQVRVVPT